MIFNDSDHFIWRNLMFKYLFALLFFLSGTILPSVIHMTIMEKEISPDIYQRRVFLGDLHFADKHDIRAQEQAISTNMEEFMRADAKALLYYEGMSEKSISLLRLLAKLAGNPDADLDTNLAGLLSRRTESYISRFDPREEIALICNFIEIVGHLINERIEQSKPYDDVLAKFKDTYTIKNLIDEYQKSIDVGIDAATDLVNRVTNPYLKTFARSMLRYFTDDNESLQIVRIPEKLINCRLADFLASFMQKLAEQKELSAEEKEVFYLMKLLRDFYDDPRGKDALLEFPLFGKLLSTTSPQIIVTVSGEIHNQNILNFCEDEGFEIIYDSQIRLKKGGSVTRLFEGPEFSEEWLEQFPTFDGTTALDHYIQAISADELKLMTRSREELLAMKNNSEAYNKDEL